MSDDAEYIRRQMQNVRQEMGADVKEIVHGARQLTDWRYHVRTHPWACVAGAFAVGFLLMPARKAAAAAKDVNVDQLLTHLKNQGLNVAAGRAASFAPGGMLGRVIAVAGPYVARTAINAIAHRLAATNDEAAERSPAPPHAP
jgi:hypothetical protein